MSAPKIDNEVLIGSTTIREFTVNSLIADYLVELAKTGFYGNCTGDVVKTLLHDAVLKAVQQQQLPRIPLTTQYAPDKGGDSPKK